MLIFDAAVVLESQCDEVWEEYMAMHPGTTRVRELLIDKGHKCGNPVCEMMDTRKRFQLFMGRVFQGDKELFLKFIAKVEPSTSRERVAELLKSMKKPEDPWANYTTMEYGIPPIFLGERGEEI